MTSLGAHGFTYAYVRCKKKKNAEPEGGREGGEGGLKAGGREERGTDTANELYTTSRGNRDHA